MQIQQGHTHTHTCTHRAWLSGSHSKPGSVCLKCLLYAILQSPRDMTGWLSQLPLRKMLQASRLSPEHGLRHTGRKSPWKQSRFGKRMRSASSQQLSEAEGWRGERERARARALDFQAETKRKNPHRNKENETEKER